jgi:hypothetical protein
MISEQVKWVDGAGQNFAKTHGKEVPLARQEGFDALRINNTQDNSGRFNGVSDVAAVFNPAVLRSRFAAFNPAKRNSADLLAGLAPYVAPLGATALGAALLAQEDSMQ